MKIDVTLNTKIYDLLKSYPFLEEELIKINPRFKKLKNPILRRTVARIASVKQAAAVGGMDEVELLNRIRRAVGLSEVSISKEEKSEEVPFWIIEEAQVEIDANELLNREESPLTAVNKALKKIGVGGIILVKSDFKPQPLIDEFSEKGYRVYSKEVENSKFLTYIQK